MPTASSGTNPRVFVTSARRGFPEPLPFTLEEALDEVFWPGGSGAPRRDLPAPRHGC